jgi:hypothetical protein
MDPLYHYTLKLLFLSTLFSEVHLIMVYKCYINYYKISSDTTYNLSLKTFSIIYNVIEI